MLAPVPVLPKPPPPARGKKQRASTAKRKRGGQRGNQNARKSGAFSLCQPGPLSEASLRVRNLRYSFQDGALSPDVTMEQARVDLQKVVTIREELGLDLLATVNLEMKLIKIIADAQSCYIPAILRQRALESIARDPFGYFERHYQDRGVSRDADSFFPVSKLSARNSSCSPSRSIPVGLQTCISVWGGVGGGVEAWSQAGDGLSPDHPSLATNLTDEQWAVLAPLIPPDRATDWLTGEPPVIIAASRWGFTRYSSTGEFNDFVIMQTYNQVLQRYPTLLASSQVASSAKKRGRPRNAPISPRSLLDAIFWKLATGQTWDDLPFGFPPMRLCRKYYRRLFLSGRLYTLLLALYNHMRLEAVIDPCLLLEQGVFTTTPSQHIALSPNVLPTWENYTALLFMQLARDAYLHFEKEKKRKNRHYCLMPVLKGFDYLSTGELPDSGQLEPLLPIFQPLEKTSAGKKWKQIERVERELAKRLRHPDLLKQPPPKIQEEPDE